MIKERFTVPQWNPPGGGQQSCIPRGGHGLRFRVKQKIEIQKPHFLK